MCLSAEKLMNYIPYLALVVTLLSVYFNFYQLRKSRRDQFINEMLVSSYLRIERAFARNYDSNPTYREMENEWNLDLENALAELQLLGPRDIAELVTNYIKSLKDNPNPQEMRSQMIKDIRNHLRKELGLQPIDTHPQSLRYVGNK